MPGLRGIEVSITAISGAETCKLPEFPHPDGSSVNVYSSESNKHSSFLSPRKPPPSPTHSDGGGVLVYKSNPKIAVYIPSVPGKAHSFLCLSFPLSHLHLPSPLPGALALGPGPGP